MKCPNCGKEIKVQATFCGYCGKRTNKRNSTNRTKNPVNPGKSIQEASLKGKKKKTRKHRNYLRRILLGALIALLFAGVAFGIMWIVHTGRVTEPEKHVYTIVVGRMSWPEAKRYANDLGGYLIQFDDKSEFDQVTTLIENAGLVHNYFFIGGRREADSVDYYWDDQSRSADNVPLNHSNIWCHDLWLEGEPSYEWDELQENCMQLYYSETNGRWVWNDVPEKLQRPKEDRLCGFVVEFDSAASNNYKSVIYLPGVRDDS